MDFGPMADRGLVLLGCGKMGSALLAGWLARGLPAASVHVVEPSPSAWLKAQGVALNGTLPASPAVALLAVKPQMMGAALPSLQALGSGSTLFVSIAAGTKISTFEDVLGTRTPISQFTVAYAAGPTGGIRGGSFANYHDSDAASQVNAMHARGTPDAPAGESMTRCRVAGGTCISKLRSCPYFAGAPLAPWMRGACGAREASQVRLERCGS